MPAALLVLACLSAAAQPAEESMQGHAADVSSAVTPRAAEPRAAGAFRKAASPASSGVARRKTLARDDLEAGRAGDAYHRLRPGVAEADGDPEYLALLALAALHVHRSAEALVIYERLVRVQPEHPRWRIGLALSRERLGLDSADSYREALALSEGASEIRALLESKLADLHPPDLG